MIKYQKIENIINYDAKGKNIVGFTKTFEALKDVEFIGTEKVDGTNIGIVWDGYNISFQGRTERADIPKHLLEYLNDKFLNHEMENVFEQLFGDKYVVIFGEGYGYKIQNGGDYFSKEECSFIAFDININNVYLERENVEDICGKLNIPVVPVIYRGLLKNTINHLEKNSKVAEMNGAIKNNIEGMVCQPIIPLYDKKGNRIIFKVKIRDIEKYKK